ncbi:hypothetical protein BGX29_003118 [Mortierella sp. GBA35]|nr:hypothetical protein BGX29_003118 [Mortierella sp. GBA35]
MPIATLDPYKNSSQPDLHFNNNNSDNQNNNNNSSLDTFIFLKNNNGSSNHLRYHNNNNDNNSTTTPAPSSPSPSPALLYQHRFETDSNNNISSQYTFNHSPSLTPMTTDDETSSSASFRTRPRQLSKPGSMPSPLGSSTYHHNHSKGNGNSLALSSFSFLSSSDKSSNPVTHPNDGGHLYNNNNIHHVQTLPPNSQLRVRHLERNSTYAGYLTKFTSRTFFSRKQWKRRYFILSQKSLHCFKSSDPQHPLLESITLGPDTIICVTDMFAGKRFCLQISCPGEKDWYVLADTASEMSGWLRELKGTVQRVRTLQVDSRPPTLYSEVSEISDMSSSTSGFRGAPYIPTISSQYESLDRHSRSSPGSLAASSRHGGSSAPSHFYSAQGSLNPYHGQAQAKSLSPPPRPITPKSSTPTPGSGPQYQHQQQRTQGSYSHGQNHEPSLSSSAPDPLPAPEPRRRRNSSLSTGQPATDYASFGTVMARAEAMAEAQKESPSSSWSLPAKYEGSHNGSATLPRSKRDSIMSTMSSMSSSTNSYKMSAMTGRPDALATLSNRSNQRMTGSHSRPMSPVSPRPMSPSMTRTSPRNSLVIAPPPRSIHRPVSVSIRHSTQILPPPQIITAGLSSQYSSGSPLSPNPPTSSLPATPDSTGNHYQQMYASGALSRITSLRHQRDTALNRQSMVSVSSNYSGPTGTGSLQERVQRSSSKTNIMRPSMSAATIGVQSPSKSTADWVHSNRPLSPTPSLSSAPTLPLPQPPRSNSSSPSKDPTPSITSTSSQSSTTTAQSQSTEQSSRRMSTIPRHHEPDLTIPHRSKTRSRSGSHETAVLVSKLNEVHLNRKAETPSPRLSAVITPSQVSSPTSPGSGVEGGHRHLRQMSLPLQTMYVLPDPPTRETPPEPKATSSTTPSRPLKQRSAGSSTSLRPLSLAVGQQVPSLGGGIARRSSNASSSTSGGSNGDLMVNIGHSSGNHRLSAQILPLQTVLPAPPTTALPSKPTEVSDSKKAKKVKAHQASPSTTSTTTTGTGFGAILEEEEEGDDDDDDDDEEESEFGTSLPFEELEAVKQSTEQDLDQDSTATTPTTSLGTRPEYYATKERTVVEYIFPSEAFPV